jgi:hypothetical protein
MKNDSPSPAFWWGSFELRPDVTRQWRIGPMRLLVRSLDNEWQVAFEREEIGEDNGIRWDVSDTDDLPDSLKEFARYIFLEPSTRLTITPLLADRHVICRPSTPFNLTAGEEVTLYVSSPVWLSLAVGDAQKKLGEIAIQRASDTWFGPSTREGELCYASTTHARLALEELPQRPHRAITPVLIRNRADSTLSVERLNVPAPLLSLYGSEDGQLWTPGVTLMRERDGDMAELQIMTLPPKEAAGATLLSKPRKTSTENVLIRAFSTVFS